MGIPLGSVPTSALNDTDNIIFAEGEAPRKTSYLSVKQDIVGGETLTTSAQTVKSAINELDADVGDKTQLTTTNKSSLVVAINENKASTDSKALDTDSSRTTTAKDVTGAINELNSTKINKTAIVNNLAATVAGSVLDATQGKTLNDKITTLPVKASSKNIDSDTGNWMVEVMNVNSDTNNTYPYANFGGTITQHDSGYFRYQVAVAGWGTTGMWFRSINAGTKFSSDSENTKWKKLTYTVV